ncbi:tetratricopeptide repeat protein [Bacteroides sp.]
MKKSIRIILFILSLLCIYSCKNKPYPQCLLTADSLTNVQPDSAITLLANLKDSMSTQTEATQMYYRLLCIKANDKAYILNTSDSLILPILHYYIKKEDERHLPEAYYYAGRVYRDLGDAPQALSYFGEALKAMKKNNDYQLKSRIYSQIGTLFFYQGITDEALKAFRKAYQCDTLLNDSAGIAFDLQDIAETYRLNNNIDSALYYHQTAYDLASAMQCQTLVNMAQSQIASIYNQLKKYDLAKEALQPSLAHLHKPSKSSIYSIASELYHETGHTDSATYYYNELLTCGTIYAKQAAHQGLARIAIAQKRPQEALSHLQQYIECTDSIQRTTDTEVIRKMSSLYNYHLREKENEQLKMENEQNKISIIFILAISVILATLSFAYLQYSRKRRLELNIQLEKLKQLKEEQHNKSVQHIEENKKQIDALEKRIQHLDEASQTLKEQLQRQKEIILCTNKQTEIDLDEQEQAKAAFINSDIYAHFKTQAHSSQKVQITANDWKVLENNINSAYKGFTKNLRKLYELSEHELHICLLIKINIQPRDMANLTNHTKESIASTRRRLYKKVFHQKGAPNDWDEFILSL